MPQRTVGPVESKDADMKIAGGEVVQGAEDRAGAGGPRGSIGCWPGGQPKAGRHQVPVAC